MRIMPRGKMTQWVRRGRFVVAVPVEVVYPVDDPSEPCLEPATMSFLDKVAEACEAGDVDYLRTVGKVFKAVPRRAGRAALRARQESAPTPARRVRRPYRQTAQ